MSRRGKVSSVSADGADGLPGGSFCRAKGCILQRGACCFVSVLFRLRRVLFSAKSCRPRGSHVTLEPYGVLVEWQGEQRRNSLYVCSKSPWGLQSSFCRNGVIVGQLPFYVRAMIRNRSMIHTYCDTRLLRLSTSPPHKYLSYDTRDLLNVRTAILRNVPFLCAVNPRLP